MKNIKSIMVIALFLMTAINTNAQGKSRLSKHPHDVGIRWLDILSCRF